MKHDPQPLHQLPIEGLKEAVEGDKTSFPERFEMAAIGLESEFTVLLDDEEVDPAAAFGDPTSFIRTPLMHRTGTSYHTPNGGALYFDTGVIEVVTPVIEIERGCAARAGRSLWEGICFLHEELAAWQEEDGRRPRLRGFSTHYNVSALGPGGVPPSKLDDLAFLLTHLLPVPVMLLALNRRSTGVGVRPRGDRIEITADFTPSPALTVATATLITAVVRATMGWESHALSALTEHDIPVIDGFEPMPHTSREGWLARYSCYPDTPFHAPPREPRWKCRDGKPRSLLDIGRAVFDAFREEIEAIADPFSARLLHSLLVRGAPVLLDLPDRPAEYDDVGRLCDWSDLFPERYLGRSRYERVLFNTIRRVPLDLPDGRYTPVGMRGWSRVLFQKDDGRRKVVPIDHLLRHLPSWGEPRDRA